jgi:penicillin-binding protein 1A
VATAELSYQGTINVTRATAISDNTVYAQLGVDVGMHNVDQIAHEMGITSRLTANPAEAIGGLKYGVSALQMADAYATLANGGDHVAPTIISKVIGPRGYTIYTGNPHRTQVFTPGQAYAGTQTLETVLQYGTGTGASYGCPAAGKTGTTNNYTDAWFVGYSPKLSTAVWVGYPNSEIYMNDVNGLGPGYGGTLAAPIWKQFMQGASDGYCQDFPQPAQYWHGVQYLGKHAVGAYVYTPPPAVTTTATSTTTTGVGTNTSAGLPGGGGTTNPNQANLPTTPPTAGNQPGKGAGNGNGNGGGNGGGAPLATPPPAGGGN